jgi:hypothetical protein
MAQQSNVSATSATSNAAEALFAKGPFPRYAEEMMLFGQFVGSWDIDWRGLDGEGRWREARGEWHFAWVLQGRAVQDVWIVPSREERERHESADGEYGTTIRVYDPDEDVWNVTWNGPAFATARFFVARQEGDEIVMRGADSQGRPTNWIFFEVSQPSFRWRNIKSQDGGTSWELHEEMFVRRRA